MPKENRKFFLVWPFEWCTLSMHEVWKFIQQSIKRVESVVFIERDRTMLKENIGEKLIKTADRNQREMSITYHDGHDIKSYTSLST